MTETMPSENMPTVQLMKALLEVQREVQPLAKDGKNDHHKYRYATSESIIDAGRQWLNAHGLLLVPVNVRTHAESLVLTTAFQLVHAVSGGTLELKYDLPYAPGAGRPADKASLGSRTENLAYAYRDILSIPRGLDGDVSGREDRPAKTGRPPKPAKSSKPEPGKLTRAQITLRMTELLELIGESGCKALTAGMPRKTDSDYQAILDVLEAHLKNETT